jgi:hypothetical protein
MLMTRLVKQVEEIETRPHDYDDKDLNDNLKRIPAGAAAFSILIRR